MFCLKENSTLADEPEITLQVPVPSPASGPPSLRAVVGLWAAPAFAAGEADAQDLEEC